LFRLSKSRFWTTAAAIRLFWQKFTKKQQDEQIKAEVNRLPIKDRYLCLSG
jgi:hypothetical protein